MVGAHKELHTGYLYLLVIVVVFLMPKNCLSVPIPVQFTPKAFFWKEPRHNFELFFVS